MTDTITTTTAKSATDTLADPEYLSWVESVRVGIYSKAYGEWSAKSAAEAIAAANVESRSKVTTKKAALQILADKAWAESDLGRKIAALESDADKERRIFKSIAAAPEHHEAAKARVAEKISAADWVNYRNVMEYAADARKAQVKADLWEAVSLRINSEDHPMLPLEAFESVKDAVRNELLSAYGFRSTSRSTSVLKNLDDDIKREAQAEWLNDMFWTI